MEAIFDNKYKLSDNRNIFSNINVFVKKLKPQ